MVACAEGHTSPFGSCLRFGFKTIRDTLQYSIFVSQSPKSLSNFITKAGSRHMPHKSFGSCCKVRNYGQKSHLVVPNNHARGTIPDLHLPHGVGKFHYGTIPNPTQIHKLFQQLFDFKLWLIVTSCGMPLLSPW